MNANICFYNIILQNFGVLRCETGEVLSMEDFFDNISNANNWSLSLHLLYRIVWIVKGDYKKNKNKYINNYSKPRFSFKS